MNIFLLTKRLRYVNDFFLFLALRADLSNRPRIIQEIINDSLQFAHEVRCGFHFLIPAHFSIDSKKSLLHFHQPQKQGTSHPTIYFFRFFSL